MNEEKNTSEEAIPVFNSWKSWYWLTVIILLIQIALFFAMSKFFE